MQLLFGVAVALTFVGIGYCWGRSSMRERQEKRQPQRKMQEKQWNFDLSKEKAPIQRAG